MLLRLNIVIAPKTHKRINPTPTATPDKHIIGTLEAEYLEPIRMSRKLSGIIEELTRKTCYIVWL